MSQGSNRVQTEWCWGDLRRMWGQNSGVQILDRAILTASVRFRLWLLCMQQGRTQGLSGRQRQLGSGLDESGKKHTSFSFYCAADRQAEVLDMGVCSADCFAVDVDTEFQ